MFFILVLGLSTIQLKAQQEDTEKSQPFFATEIIEAKPVLVELPSVKLNDLKIVNRHRDLINALVESKIRCTLDLFTITNDRAAC
ncbi:hypothetical protein BN863_7600 [Formosa agariphila KMM 3901]|uniref:Uncharacterized protein n=2 Tax=Formosa TaxID=225842 RepID=T2KHY9_FORAG|nr:hypothetical protein BN863_7600 [Formosa agariphila KMM 3901]